MEPSTNGETQQLSWLQQQHKSSRQSSEQIPGPFASLPFSSSSDVFPDATLMSEWSYLATSSGPPLTTSLEDVALIRQIFSNSTSATVSSSKEWQCLSNNVNINVGAIKAEDNCATGMACLQSLDSDPGFVERAAKFSSFGGKFAQSDVSFQQTVPDSLKGVISRTASCPPTVGKDGSIPRTLLPVPEEASVVISDKSSAGNAKLCSDSITRKRKTDRSNAQNQKVSSDSEESKQKRSRGTENEDTKLKSEEAGNNSKGHSAESTPEAAKENVKPLEPPKDYIHVRARRGQATDSHSLAERVRREKISERMRYLQDLVPGCNKVTGKAVMLDEIINYVKSLQRQVEFLSMKLAAVNPRLDFNIDHLIPKEMMATPSGAIPTELSSYIQFQHNQQQLASIQPGGCCVSDIPTVATSAQTTSLHVTDSSAEIFMDLDFQGHAPPAWEGDMQNAFNLSMMQSRQPQPQNQYSQLLPGHIES